MENYIDGMVRDTNTPELSPCECVGAANGGLNEKRIQSLEIPPCLG